MNNVNTSVGNTSVGEEEYTLYGKSTITESLRGLAFQISANSFFQTNTHQVKNNWYWMALCHEAYICISVRCHRLNIMLFWRNAWLPWDFLSGGLAICLNGFLLELVFRTFSISAWKWTGPSFQTSLSS